MLAQIAFRGHDLDTNVENTRTSNTGFGIAEIQEWASGAQGTPKGLK